MVSPISVCALDRSSSNEQSNPFDKEELHCVPLPPPSMVSRRKFRPQITIDTSRTNGSSLYFPCGKAITKESYTPDETDSNSSTPEMKDDDDYDVDDIVLTRTGFVDDVVTPYMPKLPESCWPCIQNVERTGKTPSPPPIPGPPPRATRRVSFSDSIPLPPH